MDWSDQSQAGHAREDWDHQPAELGIRPETGQPYQARRAKHARSPGEFPRPAATFPSREQGPARDPFAGRDAFSARDTDPSRNRLPNPGPNPGSGMRPSPGPGPGPGPNGEPYLARDRFPSRYQQPARVAPFQVRDEFPARQPYPVPRPQPAVQGQHPARMDHYDTEYDLRPVRRRNVSPSVRTPAAKRKRGRGPLIVTGVIVISGAVVIGLEVAGILPPGLKSKAAATADGPHNASPQPSLSAFGPGQVDPTAANGAPASATVYASLPGVGSHYGAQIPADSSQVVVAYGSGLTSTATTVEYFQKVPAGWQLEDTWAGHNGDGGWVLNKTNGDLKSPIGVFTLTDAGGQLPNPGTKLSYLQSAGFEDSGKGFLGESLADAFNYVIAINYNHEPGTSPLSQDYPLGTAAGTGIWLHVDHGGPTHACVSIPQDGVKTLLASLNPTDDPVIVMGDKTDLANG